MSDVDYVGPLTERQKGHLPDHLGLEWREARPGHVSGRFQVRQHHMAPNGFLHAASVIALADSACGYGSFISMPSGGVGFTTIELKCNFLGTARDGAVAVDANGTFQVDASKIKQAVTDLTRDIMTLQAEGSYAKAKALIDRLGVVRPEVQVILDRLKDVPVDIEPRFATAESLTQ